jgi:hypothetical protein
MFSLISRVIRFLIILGYILALVFTVQQFDNWMSHSDSPSISDIIGLIVGILVCLFVFWKIIKFFLRSYF